MRDLIENFSVTHDWSPPPRPPCNPHHGVNFKIYYFLTSFYYETLYISSILVSGHTGVVTFLV